MHIKSSPAKKISAAIRHPFVHRASVLAAALLTVVSIVGCGGAGNIANTVTTTPANAAPAVITVSDAPLSNILSAQVTISSILVTPSGGGAAVSVLSAPAMTELSGLGAVQEPIEISTLPLATYNAVTVTVSAATVTYLNSTGQAVTATATLGTPTVTVALNPALTVATASGVDLQIAFNLASSFSITGTAVTFTPAINTVGGNVEQETDGARQVEVTGSVVSISPTSVTVQSGDSGRQFTFTISSTTTFPTGVTPATIPTGSIVQLVGQTQPDGSILALSVTPESGMAGSGGGSGGGMGEGHDGAKGIITAVTSSGGVVSSFTMVPRESFGNVSMNNQLTVTVLPTTTYAVSEDAVSAGVPATAFTAADLFAGESVDVMGSAPAAGAVTAQQITLGGEGLSGTLSAAPQGTAPTLDLSLTLPSTSYLTTYTALTSLNVTTSQATNYDGSLTVATLVGDPAGTALEVHGYLLMTGPGTYVFYASEIKAAEQPETPTGGGD